MILSSSVQNEAIGGDQLPCDFLLTQGNEGRHEFYYLSLEMDCKRVLNCLG